MPSRRDFLGAAAGWAFGTVAQRVDSKIRALESPATEPVIDIHQHTLYGGRNGEELLAHQRALGATRTVLLPAGSLHGLGAGCGGNQSVLDLARRHPGHFVFFANEVAGLPGARQEIIRFLELGAIGIGEQKFNVSSDSRHIEQIAEIAHSFGVPVLMHFQYAKYNTNFPRFTRILSKFPDVRFIGHAQTWWANIQRSPGQAVLYPKGKVFPGGLTDIWLSEFPNLYGDLSARCGLNALCRDEEFARGFLERHQDKLMFGSDCADFNGQGRGCIGAQIMQTIRRLAPARAVERKVLFDNARRVVLQER
jgi:uncharacterized protein